ncbi:Kelch repeat and BTB domain-containing protein 3 [Collichthys lucidus]|uniref:Kelch repeat and BTB domain-containing protein 3 n=1 Tax=Collichthys lucidus TaxID=240159 RepID=A0A4U5V0I5_COLLU|nr:Kelch repeat and BTB domain-containing protein 3 [Collichthys lucidus]
MDEPQESSPCMTNAHNPSSSRCSSPPSSKPGTAPQCNGVPECRTLLRMSESHGLQLLSVLRSFREQGLMAMFEVDMRERDDGSVTLGNQCPVAVGSFLDFAYSGETLITDSNVDVLFQLASFLQVPVLSRACSDFLIGTMDLSNCLSLLSLAEGYGSAPLIRSANEFVIQNFSDLSKTQDFLEMQTLQDSDTLLSKSESCLALLSEAQSRQDQYSGLLTDARPATTQSYIYIHKTEENGEIRHTFCYCLETDQWKELGTGQGEGTATIPDPPGSCLTSYAEKMFVTGGCRGNCCRAIRLHVAEPFHDATDEVWCFCPVTLTCTPAPAMLKPRTTHTAVTCLDRLYVIGGRTKGSRGGAPSLLEVEYYNPQTKTWCAASPLPTAIFYPEASACGSVIYTLGSEVELTDSFNPSLDCFFCYDAQKDQWSRLMAEFGQFFHATLVKAVSVNNTLHLCDLSTYKVYSFCPETCVWKGEGSFECAGFNAGAVGMRDRIYILGGDYSPDEITDEVQVYYSGRSQWEEVAPMPRALTEFHCQLISFNRYRDPWGDTA